MPPKIKYGSFGGVKLGMWRQLFLNNEKDFRGELSELKITNPDSIPFMVFKDTLVLKAVKISENQLKSIKEFSEALQIFLINSPFNEENLCNLILSISPNQLNKLITLFHNSDSDEVKNIGNELIQLSSNLNKTTWLFQLHDRELLIETPLIMGILNVTPDSFSDGGKYFSEEQAYTHAITMLEKGADIIDIGGESTRPGSSRVNIDEEWTRISGVIERLSKIKECVISVDSYKSQIARRALEHGAHIINDISGLIFDPEMVNIVSEYQAPLVLMHIQGTPNNMQKNPQYENLIEEIYQFLDQQSKFALNNGVNQIIIDPGLGFGKRPEDNFEIIRRLTEFKSMGYPILLGSSRKSFIGYGLGDMQIDRLSGTYAVAIIGMENGANILRIHDVGEVSNALKIATGIRNLKATINKNN